MKKYGYSAISLPLEDVWNKTLEFFENNKGKIKDLYVSPNNIYRKLRIRHGFSTHVYGTSMGETYEMIFGYNPSDDTTYVSVSAEYSNMGKGFPSKVPKDMLNKWANEMGIISMKLVKEIDNNFLVNLDKFQHMSQDEIVNLSKVFCYACGEENSKRSTYCVYCGIQLNS